MTYYRIDGQLVHVNRTGGAFIGQLRGIGCRNWRTVTGRCKTPEYALAAAARKMQRDDHRVRVLFDPTQPSYYGPTQVLDCKRVSWGFE